MKRTRGLVAQAAAMLLILATPAIVQVLEAGTSGPSDDPVDGHRILLRSGREILGLAENPGGADRFLVVKTAAGRTEVPRDEIVSIRPVKLEAAFVFTPTERYERRVTESWPRTAEDHVVLGKWCLEIGAVREAGAHFQEAGRRLGAPPSDADLARRAREGGVAAEGLADLVEALGLARKGRFEELIAKLADLREALGSTFERILRPTAHAAYRRDPGPLFRAAWKRSLLAKLGDKTLTLSKALEWATGPDGLPREIFGLISDLTGVGTEEARRIWGERKREGVWRYGYGAGTFLHPEMILKAGNAPAPGPPTGDAWWKTAGARAWEELLRAWFAEFSGVLEVLRIERRNCKSCGGKGVRISNSINTSRQIRTICPACNFAGHERIVVCR